MIFDLVAKATLHERYGPRSASLQPFLDYAELESRGEDPRSLRAQGFLSVRASGRSGNAHRFDAVGRSGIWGLMAPFGSRRGGSERESRTVSQNAQ